MNDNENPTKDMSPFGAALFNAFKPGSQSEQIRRLDELNKRIEQGEFVLRRHTK